MLDRQTIEETLQRIQAGEISLEQASSLLLNEQSAKSLAPQSDSVPTNALHETQLSESLESLLDRLGSPPPDIADAWRDQYRELLTSFGLVAPRVSLADLGFSESGQLHWLREPAATATSDELTIEQAVATFEQSIRGASFEQPGEIPIEDNARLNDVTPRSVNFNEGVDTKHDRKKDDGRVTLNGEKPQSTRLQNAFIAAGLAGCIGAVGWILFAQSGGEVVEVSDHGPLPPSNPFSVASGNAGVLSSSESSFPSTSPNGGGQNQSRNQYQGFGGELDLAIESFDANELETLESISDAEFKDMETAAREESSFSLDQFMPMLPDDASDGTDPQAIDPLATDPQQEHVPKASTLDSSSEMSQDSDSDLSIDVPTSLNLSGDNDESELSEPEELPQKTQDSPAQRATIQYARLPDSNDTQDERSLISETVSAVKALGFPTDVALEVAAVGEKTWTINDTKKDVPLAELKSTSQGLSFRWLEDGRQSPLSGQLQNGRIETELGEKIYLRPMLHADAWSITLDEMDVRPTWDLKTPILQRVSRLSVSLDLPEQVEESWVEMIEPDKIRKAQGSVMLVPVDGESVSLAMRLEFKFGRKATCRIRYAARLDSSQAWQPVSRPLLDQFANQLTMQAGLVSREAQRLSNVYSIAGPRGKQIIRIKQKRNDGLAEQVREIADRVAELQSLIASVESEAKMQFRVWTQWPDGEQTILMCGHDPNETDTD
ncbi:hypothetical protein N9N28_12175 [Rubripirellula amarantea]|nr:hypothetical protein [Rubripirellula amarantea]